MIDTISTLLKHAVDLLREGEIQRGKFYKEVVEPLHACYLRLKQNHNETFGLCVTELQKLEPDYARLARELEKRTVTESIDWLTIDVFTRDHAPNPRREIADAFSQYINTLDKCVETIEGERGIVFYGGLRNCIPSPILAQFLRPGDSGFGRPSLNSQELREKTMFAVMGLQKRYADFCSQVDVYLLVLRRMCLV